MNLLAAEARFRLERLALAGLNFPNKLGGSKYPVERSRTRLKNPRPGRIRF